MLNGALFTLLSVFAAVQAAHAEALVSADRPATAIAHASEPQTGLSSGSLRLAIHVNRDKVEGDDDSTSGSSADEDGQGDTKTDSEDRQESGDDERASRAS